METPPASLAAVMVVWPGVSAVMTPASSMVATLASEEVSGRSCPRRPPAGRWRAGPGHPAVQDAALLVSVTLVGTMAAGGGSGVAVGAGVEVGAGAAVSGVASALREVSAGWGTAWAAVLAASQAEDGGQKSGRKEDSDITESEHISISFAGRLFCLHHTNRACSWKS